MLYLLQSPRNGFRDSMRCRFLMFSVHSLHPFLLTPSDWALATYSMGAELAAGDQGIATTLICQGLIPCAPFTPTLTITTQLLEVYQNIHLCCPHFTIQPFVKGIYDLHGVLFCPYLSQQFSISYDLYLSILEEVRKCMDVALECDSPNWRLQNSCPACTYKLEGEAELIFKMLL